MVLKNKILSDPVTRWVFRQSKQDIFLVGGYIRDLLRGEESKDRDFVLAGNVKAIAQRTAKKFSGTFVELKKNRTCRVVLQEGGMIDFAAMVNSISRDLSLRDFTINAIAWSPDQGIIDPLKGVCHLESKLLKVIDPENLSADPLRVLRAYRIAAQLDLQIDDQTAKYLSKYSRKLKEVASERITDELIQFICDRFSLNYLRMSIEHKVLPEVIEVSANKLKNNFHKLIEFDALLHRIESRYHKLPLINKMINGLFTPESQGMTKLGVIRMYLLTNTTRKFMRGRFHKLILSSDNARKLEKIHRAMQQVRTRVTDRTLYEMFRVSEGCEIEVALLVAVRRKRNVDKYIKRAADFIKFNRAKVLNGHEIQRMLKTGPGPEIGIVQTEVERRRFLGSIRNKAEARKWIVSNLT